MNQDASLGNEALEIILKQDFKTVLDVGCGMGHQTRQFRKAGKEVTSVDSIARFDGVIETDYLKHEFRPHDVVWCSHALEHILETQSFINKLIKDCKDGGIIAITVPPLKHEIVGGHVSLWNAGLLLYRLVMSGLDCSLAKVGTYGYNISVLVKKKLIDPMPSLTMGNGDLEALAPYFPMPVKQGFNGDGIIVDWNPTFRDARPPAPVNPKKTAPQKNAPVLEADNLFEWRETPEEFRETLPKYLFWIKSDKGAWGNWPTNGPIAELFKFGQDWIKDTSEKRTAIQAGGNCGMYAAWYSKHFQKVYTFEPDPDNYKCLRANTRKLGNVEYFNKGLSETSGKARMDVTDKKNVGVHKIVKNGGIEIDVTTIDDLNLDDVDIIHLDVEGHEEQVIKGALRTIERCRPVIVTERPVNLLKDSYNYHEPVRKHDHVYIPKS